MSYNVEQLKPYIQMGADIIPINVWNKMIKGKVRGKTPVHSDWTNRQYKPGQADRWVEQGYNLGYRIKEDELVVDMDPRNYNGEDCEELIADLFGFFEFDELITSYRSVKTGGGGWHIYTTLPDGVDYKMLKETLDDYPGVEFKRKGRQVLCAGCKHPSGEYYTWFNTTPTAVEIPQSVIDTIERTTKPKNSDYSSGKGCMTGTQLSELVLDKLDVEDYNEHDKWFSLMCACHHATDGDGIEEFVAWSTEDLDYSDDESVIRGRWESLWDKENSITVGSLVHALEQNGEDVNDIHNMLQFSNSSLLDEDDDELEEDEEAQILRESKEIAADIDISDIYHEPELEEGVEGKAIQMANDLHPEAHQDEVMKCLRLIKAASQFEAAKAIEIVVGKKILKQGTINKLLKEMEAQIAEDLALMLAHKTLEHTFNKGKHLSCPPSGILWAFHKTHWKKMSDEFLAKLIQQTLHQLKKKIKIDANELALVQQAVKLSRIHAATLTDKLHTGELPPSVVNCKNGELWMNKDGSHALRPHNFKSYLLNCLNVEYDPSAECPLFMETVEGIFQNFGDRDDMVRHLAEIFGYIIQPYKNIASWFLFRGPGGDGKSTVLKILGGILQDAQLNTSVKMLSAGANGGNNHILDSVVGKLSVIIEELPTRFLLKDEGVKMFSENTKMEANPKQKDAYQFMYAGGLIMCTNGYPSIRDLSHGMFRRANVIPFNMQFTKSGIEDIDRAADILSNPKEMSGVLNWMLEGLQRLRERGKFLVPDSCKEAKETWMGEANSVIKFTKECLEHTGDTNDIVGEFSHIYGMVYEKWCQDNDIDEKMRKRKMAFKQDLINLGFTIQPGKGNVLKVYGGHLTVDEFDDEFDDDF